MEIQRAIGVLQEQGRWMASEISEIKGDVKLLLERDNQQKGKIAGISAVVTLIVAGLFQIFLEFIKH